MYYYLGRIYQNANNHNDAMESFILAKDYVFRSKEPDYFLRGLVSATLGSIYIYQNEFASAINYYNEAINNYKKNDNYKNIMLSYEDLAHAQRMNRQYEAALLSNLQAMNTSILTKDTLSLVRQLGAKADIHFYYSNYHKALEILSKRDEDFPEWVKYSNMLGLYAKIYLKVDNITQARACANKLFHTSKSPERRVSALFLLSQIEKSAHNYKDALFYQGQAYLLSDSLQHIKGEKELKISEQKYNSLKLLNNVTTLLYNTFVSC